MGQNVLRAIFCGIKTFSLQFAIIANDEATDISHYEECVSIDLLAGHGYVFHITNRRLYQFAEWIPLTQANTVFMCLKLFFSSSGCMGGAHSSPL